MPSNNSTKPFQPSAVAICLACLWAGCADRAIGRHDQTDEPAASPPANTAVVDAAADEAATGPCSGRWRCEGQRCALSGTGAAGGLPLGGEHWECHRRLIDEQSATAPWPCTRPAEWICYGDVVPGAAPPGGCGWDCERFAFQRADRTVYRCQRPEGPADLPPDAFPPDDCDCGQLGRCAYCERGSGVGGTLCLVGALPPPVVDTPNGRPDCEPGATYWCDDAFEDGWGTVTCREDGSWPTEQRSGRSVVACGGGRIGARAQTVCACYHFYIDRRCCERSDCRVPSEDLEQHCPRIGSAPCAPCLPFGPDSCAPGLVCVVNEVNEGFCATRCDDGRTCSMGTRCVALQWRDAVYRACVPDNDSCYW